jgi:hypothetical protein
MDTGRDQVFFIYDFVHAVLMQIVRLTHRRVGILVHLTFGYLGGDMDNEGG